MQNAPRLHDACRDRAGVTTKNPGLAAGVLLHCPSSCLVQFNRRATSSMASSIPAERLPSLTCAANSSDAAATEACTA